MISVIVPIECSCSHISECLGNILNSSYQELEVLCVGDPLTIPDKRVRSISNKNDSISYKINLGIKLAQGEYISIVECKDSITTDMYSKLVEILKKTEADFVKCNCLGSSSVTERIVNPLLEPDILLNCDSEICNGLYRKNFLLNENITFHSNRDFSILTTLLASKIYFLSDILCSSCSDNNMIVKENWNWIDYQVRKRCIANPEQLFYLHKCKMHDYKWAIEHLDAFEALKFSNNIKDEVASSILNSKSEHIFKRLCLNADHIQIYGAGVWGNRIFDYLEIFGMSKKVSDFIVSGSSEEKVVRGIPVSSISEGFIPSREYLIIIAISGEPGKLVYSKLRYNGFRNIILLDNHIRPYITAELKRFSLFHATNSIKEIQKQSLVKIMDIVCNNQYSENIYLEIEKDLFPIPDSADNIFLYDAPKDKAAFIKLIRKLVSITKSNGKICLLADNKLGLDALCNISASKEFRYSRDELKVLLKESGIKYFKFFSVFPGRILPQILVAENIKPTADTVSKYNQMFYYPEDCIISEQELYRTLNENADIHAFAPSYFIECPLDGKFSDIEQITLTMQRAPEKATCTIIRNKEVEKIRAYNTGDLLFLDDNICALKKKGIPVVGIITANQNSIIMEKLHGVMGDEYLVGLLNKNVQLFEKKLDNFIKMILSSSDIESDDKFESVLKTGYVDLLPLNTIFIDDQFVVFDQEYIQPNFPVKSMIYRVISSLYSRYPECEELYPVNLLYKKYNLTEKLVQWKKCSDLFNKNLYGQDISRFMPYKSYIHRNQLMMKDISSNNTFNCSGNTLLKKPYRIGYCIGVFDLFHIGHVNLLKAAKEMCDYLIVAVASDADCEKSKHKIPIIPFNQRVEIVKSCKYVDEVVNLVSDAFKKYHFNVQFSGSDHEFDSKWIKIKEELRLQGSDLIFLPYTEETSSSEIREKLQ